MFGCVLSQLKPSEFYILSCEKGLGLRPRPFSQLRMWSSLGFILYVILILISVSVTVYGMTAKMHVLIKSDQQTLERWAS